MRRAALLVALVASAAVATPPLVALADPAAVVRESHRKAAQAAMLAMGEGGHAAFRARTSRRGDIYKLPAIGRPLRSEEGDPPGLLLETNPGAPVIAPTLSRVAYAGPFRRYGDVLILDHGRGWTTVLIGLGHLDVPQGATLPGGTIVGRAADRVRVQLLHHGQIADVARISGLVIPQQARTR